MTTVAQSIELELPVETVYNQWTQFEEFPNFMEGVREVRQLDDRRLTWTAEVGGEERSWEAEIVQQEPNRLISWTAVEGKPNGGTVRFEPLGTDRTRIELELEYDPEGVKEKAGSMIGADDRRVAGDLERFRDFIEERGHETGAWRGRIES